MIKAAMGVWEGNTLVFVGLETGAATMKISVAVPQKSGNRPTTDPAVPLLHRHPKGYILYCSDTCSSVLIHTTPTTLQNSILGLER